MAVACIEPELADTVLSYPEDHPQRAHAARCPRCRALLDSYQLFLKPSDLEGASHVDGAMRRIEAAVTREIGGLGAREDRVGRRASWLKRLSSRSLRPVFAMALVALVVGAALIAPRIDTRSPSTVLRGESESSEVVLERVRRSATEIDLAWRPRPEADAYRVVFYDGKLEEVGSVGPSPDTTFRVAIADLPFLAHAREPLMVRVQALQGGDVIAVSPARGLERP